MGAMSNLVLRHALVRRNACLVGHGPDAGDVWRAEATCQGTWRRARHTSGDLTASISPAAWEVLHALRARGHESYVVGGTVRDYLLGSETKDVDLCTSATPEQVQQLFRSSRVVGRRFPIIHVRQNKEVIEVSSFRTNCEDASMIPLDWYQQQQLRAKNAGGRRRGDRGDRQSESRGGKRNGKLFHESGLVTLG